MFDYAVHDLQHAPLPPSHPSPSFFFIPQSCVIVLTLQSCVGCRRVDGDQSEGRLCGLAWGARTRGCAQRRPRLLARSPDPHVRSCPSIIMIAHACPTVAQPLPNRCPTVAQPLPNRYPTVAQPEPTLSKHTTTTWLCAIIIAHTADTPRRVLCCAQRRGLPGAVHGAGGDGGGEGGAVPRALQGGGRTRLARHAPEGPPRLPPLPAPRRLSFRVRLQAQLLASS